MRFLLLPFIIIAAGGLLLALGTNLAATFAHRVLISRGVLLSLFLGIFACVLPVILVQTVLYSQRPDLRRARYGLWQELLTGCPRWLYRLCFGLAAYALVFSLWIATFDGSPAPPSARPPASRELTLAQARNMSLGPLIPYGVMLPLLLSVFRRPGLLRAAPEQT